MRAANIETIPTFGSVRLVDFPIVVAACTPGLSAAVQSPPGLMPEAAVPPLFRILLPIVPLPVRVPPLVMTTALLAMLPETLRTPASIVVAPL